MSDEREETEETGRAPARGDVDHTRTLWITGAVLIAFFGLAWGSIPLYRLVCKSLDPGGSAASNGSADEYENVEVDKSRRVTVRFTTNVQGGLAWEFRSRQPSVRVHPGEKKLVKFVAKNNMKQAVTGKGVYDINPPEAGAAFKKIECFCFQKQTLEADEKAIMPLYFWLEPDDLPEDVRKVTIGYTFFDADSPGGDKRAAAGR